MWPEDLCKRWHEGAREKAPRKHRQWIQPQIANSSREVEVDITACAGYPLSAVDNRSGDWPSSWSCMSTGTAMFPWLISDVIHSWVEPRSGGSAGECAEVVACTTMPYIYIYHYLLLLLLLFLLLCLSLSAVINYRDNSVSGNRRPRLNVHKQRKYLNRRIFTKAEKREPPLCSVAEIGGNSYRFEAALDRGRITQIQAVQ